MLPDTMDSYVKAEFYICADMLDFECITFTLNIPKFEIRKRKSFRSEMFSKDYWSIGTEYEMTNDINTQIQKIFKQIEEKADAIKTISDTYCAETGFLVTVKQYVEDEIRSLPSIYFEKEFVEFAAAINAEINMDFT